MALPQRHRLCGQPLFSTLYRKGRSCHGPLVVLRWLPARSELLPPAQRGRPTSAWRAAVVVSTKVHKRAVQRNRLRRLVHHRLLSLPIAAPQGAVWLLLSLKPGSAERGSDAVLGECQQLLQRAGLTP
ncbi:MAG: ribonuclease P protein component [Cyanobacteria bacterium J06638_7]